MAYGQGSPFQLEEHYATMPTSGTDEMNDEDMMNWKRSGLKEKLKSLTMQWNQVANASLQFPLEELI